MVKKQLSSLEIAALISEFQVLIDSKIDQIYQPAKKELIINFHIPRKGKQLLKIQLPNFIYFTEQKPSMLPPPDFCLILRKHINNSIIKKVKQLKSERIIEIELQKKDKFKLIIELFSKGNIILLNSQDQIIALLERQKWGTRELKIKVEYIPPPESFDWLNTTLENIKKQIKSSQKTKIITSLATEMGLGGTYAEEICLLSKIDKNKNPKILEETEIKEIFKTINNFKKQIQKPVGIVYQANNITPLELVTLKEIKKEKLPTYNQALNKILGKELFEIEKEEKESKFNQKANKIKKIIQKQETQIKKLENQEKISTQKAEQIYEHYQELRDFLEKIKLAKEKYSWAEIENQLKKIKKIKQVNLKEKKISLQLK
jgi:predicted ribosome quality control (RQC) complex YloA/Tae2 family protein